MILLGKLIHFDSLVLDSANDAIKHSLYDLFFAWQSDKEPESPELRPLHLNESAQDKIESDKMARLQKD